MKKLIVKVVLWGVRNAGLIVLVLLGCVKAYELVSPSIPFLNGNGVCEVSKEDVLDWIKEQTGLDKDKKDEPKDDETTTSEVVYDQ
jgi:hypothetical protein